MTAEIRHDGPVPFEYNQITEQIYIGTNMCCETHFHEELITKGITADISMEKERMDQADGVEFFLWLPTIDHTAPTLSQLQVGVATLDSLIQTKQKVYVHCKNGHGRGPTLVAAYFISLGQSVTEAIDTIKQKRPSIHLDQVQIEALEKFAQTK